MKRKIQELRNKLGDDSLIIVTADHGHKNITNAYTILDYPELMGCLIIPPSLESRCLSFFVKEDMKDTFVERFNNLFEKEFWLMTREDFLDNYKFLGTGNKHPKIDDFIGNYVALSVAGTRRSARSSRYLRTLHSAWLGGTPCASCGRRR